MTIDGSGDIDTFRAEVQNFLAENLTDELRDRAAFQAGIFSEGDVYGRWHEALYRKGWIAPSWPQAYGGPGWTPMQRMIFEAECATAGAPILPGMSILMCGPVLIRFGNDAQKAFFLPRILSGEHYWCQGYSEPQAGSDLASLRCSAVRDGDDYVVNGTKIWTTHAHRANWLFLLVRTSTEGKRQDGISFLLTPMDAPGISVRPILNMSGEHEVNQLFFDDVRIPVANRVGDENAGWSIAKYLLEFERGGGAAGMRVARVLRWLDETGEQARAAGLHFGDRHYAQKRAEIEIDLLALEWTQRRIVSALEVGQSVGDASASMLKVTAAKLYQEATQLALEALGPYGAADQLSAIEAGAPLLGPRYGAAFAPRYLNGRAISIFGGASEIQYGVIARAALGI
jgi:alkylation response protein AidB-like acyl-CoA dehydrogenase